MEGAASGAANGVLMGFGDGTGAGGFSPLMIMPLMSATAPPPPSSEHSLFFLPPPPGTAHSNHNTVTTCSGSSITHNHHQQHNGSVHISAPLPAMDGKDRSSNEYCSHQMKAKIMSHPHYPRLLSAYVNCHKLGAPPEVVARLEEVCGAGGGGLRGSRLGEDPALDQFMEAYCEMLSKYEEELSKPFKEAMLFLSRIESQFKSLALSSSPPSSLHAPPAAGHGEPSEKNVSSEEDVDISETYIDPQAEDRELKGQLLRKYSGYLGGLKQEFLKRRKKGKLPKEARHQLLEWWNRHYKWPYPSESQKLALAEATGLDQKQINNWFINQRKRHWKPSEEMQFVTVDPSRPHYFLDNTLGNPFSMGCGPALL